MNHQEEHLNCPEFNYCKECIQVVRKINRSPQSSWGPRSKLSHEFCEPYTVPDNGNCHQLTNTDHERLNGRRNKNENGDIHQKQCMDHNTLRILNNLRQRARKLIEDSNPPQCEEHKTRPRRTDACPKERTRVPNIDYSPQSNYLKMMKQRKSNNGTPPCESFNSKNDQENRQQIDQSETCHCSSAQKENMSFQRSCFKNQTLHRSDMSSVHDPCICFKTWRLKNCAEANYPDNEARERHDREEVFCDQICDKSDRAECKEQIRPGKKSGHISRKDKKKKDRRKRKSKINECTGSLEAEFCFRSSLKRPHPNSCERCWRYASPSRSPVNKPNQRFDPNYRRSHSLMNFDAATRPEENVTEHDAETRGCRFTDTENQHLPKVKSAVHIRKVQKPQNFKKKGECEADKGKHDVRAKTAPGKDVAPGKCSAMKTAGLVGDGSRPAVCFCDKMNSRRINNVQGPMQSSPSMFDKENKISPNCWSRPSTAASSKSNNKKKSSKQRPFSSSYPAQSFNECSSSPKYRPRSADRRRLSFPNSNGLQEVKENVFIGSRNPRTPYLTGKAAQTANIESGRKCGAGMSEVHEKATLKNDLIYDENCAERDHYSGSKAWRRSNVNVRPMYEKTRRFSDDVGPCQKDFQDFDCGRCCHRRNCGSSSPLLIHNPDPYMNAGSDGRNSMCFWNKMMHSKDCDDIFDHSKNQKYLRNDRKWKEKDLEENPREYCLFFMDKDDDVEVLIEELTEGKCEKSSKSDSKAEMVKSKMKKLAEHKLDSMALRFQKGISGKCRKYKNNRVLYF